MRTMITGATGFVGGALSRSLPNAIALDRSALDVTRPIPGDLAAVERIVHAAAEIDDTSRMYEVNVEGTRRLVQWARAAGVQTFALLSTGGINGSSEYARTKRIAETVALAEAGAMSVVVARLFFPYGPGQRPRRLIPRLTSAVQSGDAITTNADRGPRLSLTYIDDLVVAIERLLALQTSALVDIGGPDTSLFEIATNIGAILGVSPRFALNSVPAPDLVADSTRLRELIAFEPQTPLDAGLRQCLFRHEQRL